MGKKRSRDADGVSEVADKKKVDDESSDDDDFDIVTVDFEWFNFDPHIDFQGTKSLLRQLLDVDSSLFDISALADLVLSQPTVGSTVKVDGKEADPYAMLTVLNLREHRDKAVVADLTRHLKQKAETAESLLPVRDLLASSGKEGPVVGLVLSERLINMPSETSPPMYRMLLDEIEAAVEDKEPYEFTHYLVLSKAYHELESTLDVEQRMTKKGKKESSMLYFHPEDEELQRYASAHGRFTFTNHNNTVADSKRVFQDMGIMPLGLMLLIEASKFADAVEAIGKFLSPP